MENVSFYKEEWAKLVEDRGAKNNVLVVVSYFLQSMKINNSHLLKDVFEC